LWALGIHYHLHWAWQPQSSGEVEKVNELWRRQLTKLIQETQSPWTKLLSEIRWGIPREQTSIHPLFCPGDLVLIKLPDPGQNLNTTPHAPPPWEGPFPVILSTPMTVRMAGLDSRIHH
jgi:hypothetical protein